MTINLDLLQNAFHSCYHAIEHIAVSEEDLPEKYFFDHIDHSVSRVNPEGHISFFTTTSYSRPPAVYGYKYAILHFIQALELFLKHYIALKDSNALFEKGDKNKTISLWKAVEVISRFHNDFFSDSQIALLKLSKSIRNHMEHYEFKTTHKNARQLSGDLACLITYTVAKLFNIHLVQYFSFDQWTGDEDPMGEVLSGLLSSKQFGKESIQKLIECLRDEADTKDFTYCTWCFERTVSLNRGTCLVCGRVPEEDLLEIF